MKLSKREQRRLDELAKTDPHRAEAQWCRGELLSFAFDRAGIAREEALRASYTPGCGQPTHVEGTNGGQMPCGAKLTRFGVTALYFCARCSLEKAL